jgi:hypothetical protein
VVANGRWDLTPILLTSTKWWTPASGSKWQMGFNSAFKGLIYFVYFPNLTVISSCKIKATNKIIREVPGMNLGGEN